MNENLAFNSLCLLQLFLQLQETSSSSPLSNIVYQTADLNSDKRLQSTLQFIMQNFQSDISLDNAASKVGMNKTAFCRYFRHKTGKSFISYLNNIRVQYACKLLVINNLKKQFLKLVIYLGLIVCPTFIVSSKKQQAMHLLNSKKNYPV